MAKNNLEKTGTRNFKWANSFIPLFSEVPAFKTPSKWTPTIKDTQLELYLSEIEDEIMQIDEQGHNYPNLTKKKREAMKELMNDCNIIINQQTKEVE